MSRGRGRPASARVDVLRALVALEGEGLEMPGVLASQVVEAVQAAEPDKPRRQISQLLREAASGDDPWVMRQKVGAVFFYASTPAGRAALA